MPHRFSGALAVVAALVAFDLLAWAIFRLDKARARRRGARRIRERTLLILAAFGGVGAVMGMYGHRQRHKVAKPRFVLVAVTAALAQVALAGWWLSGRS